MVPCQAQSHPVALAARTDHEYHVFDYGAGSFILTRDRHYGTVKPIAGLNRRTTGQ